MFPSLSSYRSHLNGSHICGDCAGAPEFMNAEADRRCLVGPNFFIVGAAKAGTTALHACLAQHPDIFMSRVKEPNYFAPDLGLPQPWARDLASYLSLFAEGRCSTIRGESTPAYLLSCEAAQGVRTFCPEARILVVLRNPIDAIQSVYAEARKFGIEPERTFEAALAASDAGRPKLEARPGGVWLRYREVVRYAEQVLRWMEAFPADQMHVLLHDDLVADSRSACSGILGFLGVDSEVALNFERANDQRLFRSATVQRMYMRPYAAGRQADSPRRLAPLWRMLLRANIGKPGANRISPALREDLISELGPEVMRLGALIRRDLSHWLV